MISSSSSSHRTAGWHRPLRQLRVIPVMALLLAATLLSACSDKASGKPDNSEASRRKSLVPVTVTEVLQKTVPVQLHAIGTAEAYSTVSIKSQVNGQLLRAHFKEGQAVKRGDLLFTIDPRPFEAALRQVEGNLARDEAQLQQAEATLAQKIAAEKEAEGNLARDQAQLENDRARMRRYQDLIRDGVVSQEQYDQVHTTTVAREATVEADRAAVDNAREGIRAAQAEVSHAKATIQASRAAVDNARLQVEYTAIRAPIDGRAGNLLVDAGNVVKANDDTKSLVVIHQIHPVYVSFSVPEQHLPDIQKYLRAGTVAVEAIAPNQDGPPAWGNLTFVNNTVDPATGTIQLKATFPNKENALWPGQFLNVLLNLTTEPHAVVVPSQAIQIGQRGPYVFVVRPDLTADPRPVVVERTLEREAIIQEGLKPGERVVTDGQVRLSPGARVEIKPSTPTAASGAKSP